MYLILVILYVAFSVYVGVLGRDRIIGFSGTFLLSLMISPVVMALVVLLTSPKDSQGSAKSPMPPRQARKR